MEQLALLITALLRGNLQNERNCQRLTGESSKTEVSEKSG